MAFMIPTAEHMAMYHVETTHGTEYIPELVCGDILHVRDGGRPVLEQYCEGDVYRSCFSVERKVGWYGRLSAPGYLDCTDWQGPYETEDEAIKALCDQYDVDENGDELDVEGE